MLRTDYLFMSTCCIKCGCKSFFPSCNYGMSVHEGLIMAFLSICTAAALMPFSLLTPCGGVAKIKVFIFCYSRQPVLQVQQLPSCLMEPQPYQSGGLPAIPHPFVCYTLLNPSFYTHYMHTPSGHYVLHFALHTILHSIPFALICTINPMYIFFTYKNSNTILVPHICCTQPHLSCFISC